MADGHNPLPGAHLGGNDHPTGLILTSEHGLCRAFKKITSHMTTKFLRSGTLYFGKDRLGLSHKDVYTHPIWSGFSMELYLAKV